MSEDAIEALKALAHPLRLRILEVLREGERSVGEIGDLGNFAQPALSQQLSILRKAGLVETRKEGKLVYYRLGAEKLKELAQLIGSFAPERPTDASRPSAFPGAANFARIT